MTEFFSPPALLAFFSLFTIFVFVLTWRSRRNAESHREQQFEEEEERRRTRQHELGMYAHAVIRKEVSKNPLSKRADDADPGPLKVYDMPENGGSYSVIVAMSGINGLTGCREWDMNPILQFSVRLGRTYDELHVHFGSYGADITESLETTSVEEFLEKHVKKHIQELAA